MLAVVYRRIRPPDSTVWFYRLIPREVLVVVDRFEFSSNSRLDSRKDRCTKNAHSTWPIRIFGSFWSVKNSLTCIRNRASRSPGDWLVNHFSALLFTDETLGEIVLINFLWAPCLKETTEFTEILPGNPMRWDSDAEKIWPLSIRTAGLITKPWQVF